MQGNQEWHLRAISDNGADVYIPFILGVQKLGRIVSNKTIRRPYFICIEDPVTKCLQQLWKDESGQDIAEYAVMLAVILVIVVGTVRLIGTNANTVFSQVGSAIQ